MTCRSSLVLRGHPPVNWREQVSSVVAWATTNILPAKSILNYSYGVQEILNPLLTCTLKQLQNYVMVAFVKLLCRLLKANGQV